MTSPRQTPTRAELAVILREHRKTGCGATQLSLAHEIWTLRRQQGIEERGTDATER